MMLAILKLSIITWKYDHIQLIRNYLSIEVAWQRTLDELYMLYTLFVSGIFLVCAHDNGFLPLSFDSYMAFCSACSIKISIFSSEQLDHWMLYAYIIDLTWKHITLTASRSFWSSFRYLIIHVKTLAVVSWAAKRTPMMLSAIWSSDKIFPPSSWKLNKWSKRSLSTSLFSFLPLMISVRIWLSLLLACIFQKIYRKQQGNKQNGLIQMPQIINF